jgi:V-type H+-transporting ATPase proteolipid subunit
LGAGLAMGLAGIASGIAIGSIGEATVKASSKDSSYFFPMFLVLIFAEAIGFYGLIIALISASTQV